MIKIVSSQSGLLNSSHEYRFVVINVTCEHLSATSGIYKKKKKKSFVTRYKNNFCDRIH